MISSWPSTSNDGNPTAAWTMWYLTFHRHYKNCSDVADANPSQYASAPTDRGVSATYKNRVTFLSWGGAMTAVVCEPVESQRRLERRCATNWRFLPWPKRPASSPDPKRQRFLVRPPGSTVSTRPVPWQSVIKVFFISKREQQPMLMQSLKSILFLMLSNSKTDRLSQYGIVDFFFKEFITSSNDLSKFNRCNVQTFSGNVCLNIQAFFFRKYKDGGFSHGTSEG